jgi:exopolysaccharide biosynthesis polyprenyl glycosylphosphotransferase
MISRVYYYTFLLRVIIYLLPVFAFAGSFYVRFGQLLQPQIHYVVPQYYVLLLLFTQIVWIIAATYYKVASVEELFWEFTGMRMAFLACLTTLLLQTALLVFVKQLIISRVFVVLSNVFLFLGVIAVRSFFRLTSSSATWPRKCEKILVVGTDQYARRCVKLLRRIPFLGCDIRGYVQLPGQPVLVQDAPVVSAVDHSQLEGLTFDEVLVAIPAKRYLQVSSVLDHLQNLGKPIRAILDFGPRLSLKEKVFQVGRLQMMNLAISPVESFAYTVLKRTFDLLVSFIGVVILSPLLAAIALLVKVSSPGPILFRQERVGRHGRHFTLLKFRTMRCSPPAESDTLWTTKGDPRCTPFGGLLRRFSLDELPQLLNVIRGEMSLVGPRPERPYFVAKFRENYQRYNVRHSCRVGMTGWAQVNGFRGDTSISDRLQHDLYYVHNWSFTLDLQIIARTMFTVLKDQNGY